MAIVKEFFETRDDGVDLYRTFSNKGYKIRKVGTNETFDEAVDIESANYTYEETDKLIKEEEIIQQTIKDEDIDPIKYL